MNLEIRVRISNFNYIFNNIKFDLQYDDLSGLELYKELHNAVSALSNLGRGEVIHELGLTEDYTITDMSSFTNSIAEQLKQQNMDTNVIKAVEKGLSPYVIPQARTKIIEHGLKQREEAQKQTATN